MNHAAEEGTLFLIHCMLYLQSMQQSWPESCNYFSVMTTSTPEKQDGLKALNQAINKIEEVITSMGGVFTIQMAVSRLSVTLAYFGYLIT